MTIGQIPFILAPILFRCDFINNCFYLNGVVIVFSPQIPKYIVKFPVKFVAFTFNLIKPMYHVPDIGLGTLQPCRRYKIASC